MHRNGLDTNDSRANSSEDESNNGFVMCDSATDDGILTTACADESVNITQLDEKHLDRYLKEALALRKIYSNSEDDSEDNAEEHELASETDFTVMSRQATPRSEQISRSEQASSEKSIRHLIEELADKAEYNANEVEHASESVICELRFVEGLSKSAQVYLETASKKYAEMTDTKPVAYAWSALCAMGSAVMQNISENFKEQIQDEKEVEVTAKITAEGAEMLRRIAEVKSEEKETNAHLHNEGQFRKEAGFVKRKRKNGAPRLDGMS